MDQKIKEIREKCIQANPEIVELKFGCEIYRKGATKREFFSGSFNNLMSIVRIDEMGAWLPFELPYPPESQEFEVIGRPIRLADVLLAIDENKIYLLIDSDGSFHMHDKNMELEYQDCRWNNSKDDLILQSPETLDFIHSLLISK